MSEALMISLIVVSINLGGMLVIYSLMAFCLARLHWRDRGIIAVLATITAAGLFWIVPTRIGFGYSIIGTPAANSLCFGNWLVSAFAVVLFCQTVKGIPRQLEDMARVDGCDWLGTYWHVVLPVVRREIGFIASLIMMATALPFWAGLTAPGGTDFRPFFEFVRLPAYDSFASMLAVSVITSLLVIVIFFFARRYLLPNRRFPS